MREGGRAVGGSGSDEEIVSCICQIYASVSCQLTCAPCRCNGGARTVCVTEVRGAPLHRHYTNFILWAQDRLDHD